MSGTSSEEAKNLNVIRRCFEAFEAGDVETLMKNFAPSVRYRHTPVGPLTGDYRGAQAVREFFAQADRETGGTLRATILALAASGDRVFVLYRETATRAGKTLDAQDVLVFTLANAAVTDAIICVGDFPAAAAFWS
jgi:ketosteroid isomerase-like protein